MVAEPELKEKAKVEIRKGRPGDWAHALRVVKWVKQLGEGRKDLDKLVVAAYIHDIGWRDVLPTHEEITLGQLTEYEQHANNNSEPFAREFLTTLHYKPEDIMDIVRLIHAVDRHFATADDEEIIVDADSLAKLTISHLKQKYQPTEWESLFELWEANFAADVNTVAAEKVLPELLAKMRAELDQELAKLPTTKSSK